MKSQLRRSAWPAASSHRGSARSPPISRRPSTSSSARRAQGAADRRAARALQFGLCVREPRRSDGARRRLSTDGETTTLWAAAGARPRRAHRRRLRRARRRHALQRRRRDRPAGPHRACTARSTCGATRTCTSRPATSAFRCSRTEHGTLGVAHLLRRLVSRELPQLCAAGRRARLRADQLGADPGPGPDARGDGQHPDHGRGARQLDLHRRRRPRRHRARPALHRPEPDRRPHGLAGRRPGLGDRGAILVADLDLAQAKRARRWNDFNQVLRDRRPEAYG